MLQHFSIREISEILFPSFCLVCGKRLRNSSLCNRCTPPLDPRELLRCSVCATPTTSFDSEERCILCRIAPLPFEYMYYLWNYESTAKDLIVALKYKPSLALTHLAAKMLAYESKKRFRYERFDGIVPIPSSAASRRERPFQVCLVLARYLSPVLNAPCLRSALHHQGYRAAQASLDHKKRFSNVRNAFRASPSIVKGKRLLLVDDVLTTGATASVACRELLNSGAVSVSLCTLARAPNWGESRQALLDLI